MRKGSERLKTEIMSLEQELEVPGKGAARVFKDLFAGAVGGVAQVLLGKFEDVLL